MHLAWRWFTGLGFDQEIPHHSTFSKNRRGRFQESQVFEQLFEEIVRQCMEVVGLVHGKHLSVDGSFLEANERLNLDGDSAAVMLRPSGIQLRVIAFETATRVFGSDSGCHAPRQAHRWN